MRWNRTPRAFSDEAALVLAHDPTTSHHILSSLKQFTRPIACLPTMNSALTRDKTKALIRKVNINAQLSASDHRILDLNENLAKGRLTLKKEVRQLRNSVNLRSGRPHPVRLMCSDLNTIHKTSPRRVHQAFIPCTRSVKGRDGRRDLNRGITQLVAPSIRPILQISPLTGRVSLLRQPQSPTRPFQRQHIEHSREDQCYDTHPHRCGHLRDVTRGTRHQSVAEGWGGTPNRSSRPPGWHSGSARVHCA